MIRVFLILLLALYAGPVTADEFKPAYLQLTQTGTTNYDAVWKVPALEEHTIFKLQPVFPPGTTETRSRRGTCADGSIVIRWAIEVPGGLDDKAISFGGVSLVMTDVLGRLARADGTEQLER